MLLVLLGTTACAEPNASGPLFYQQLIDLNTRFHAHAPSRTPILISAANGPTQWLAEHDPHLAFDLLWLEQHRDGYRYREGGAALGKLFRSLLRQAWDNYRDDGGSFLSVVPDTADRAARAYRPGTRYDLRISDDEVELGFEYRW